MKMALYEVTSWINGLLRMKNNFRKYLANNDISIFIPCHDVSWNVEDDGTITGCFYHDRGLYDKIYNNQIQKLNDEEIYIVLNEIMIEDELNNNVNYDRLYMSYRMYPLENLTKNIL